MLQASRCFAACFCGFVALCARSNCLNHQATQASPELNQDCHSSHDKGTEAPSLGPKSYFCPSYLRKWVIDASWKAYRPNRWSSSICKWPKWKVCKLSYRVSVEIHCIAWLSSQEAPLGDVGEGSGFIAQRRKGVFAFDEGERNPHFVLWAGCLVAALQKILTFLYGHQNGPPVWYFRRGMSRSENWYKVMTLTCWHVARASYLTCGTCFVRFGSLLVRLVHLFPWFVWIVQVSISKCKYCFQAICFSHVLQVVYIEIWRNCARLLVRIVVDCGWKTRLCMTPAANSSNSLLISDYF